MAEKKMTRDQRVLHNIAVRLKVPLSRFVPGPNPRMTRGIALGVSAPGDGTKRYTIEYYSGEGTGCRDAGYFIGFGQLEAFLHSINEAENIKRYNREDRKRNGAKP